MAELVAIDEISTDRVVDAGDDLTDLTNSIQEIGLQRPITLTQDLDLIDGLRRIEAYRRLGQTHIEAVVTYMYPRACESIQRTREHGLHALPLTGERIWEVYKAIHPLLMITRSHYSRGVPKGKKTPSSGGRPLLTRALGIKSEALLQAITQVHRALSNPDLSARAQEAIALIKEGKLSYYGAVPFLTKQNGLTGNVVAPSEQREMLSNAATTLRATMKAMEQLGPLHKRLTSEEVNVRITELAQSRTKLNKLIKSLQEEINNR